MQLANVSARISQSKLMRCAACVQVAAFCWPGKEFRHSAANPMSLLANARPIASARPAVHSVTSPSSAPNSSLNAFTNCCCSCVHDSINHHRLIVPAFCVQVAGRQRNELASSFIQSADCFRFFRSSRIDFSCWLVMPSFVNAFAAFFSSAYVGIQPKRHRTVRRKHRCLPGAAGFGRSVGEEDLSSSTTVCWVVYCVSGFQTVACLEP